jgi:hypothetical protein
MSMIQVCGARKGLTTLPACIRGLAKAKILADLLMMIRRVVVCFTIDIVAHFACSYPFKSLPPLTRTGYSKMTGSWHLRVSHRFRPVTCTGT